MADAFAAAQATILKKYPIVTEEPYNYPPLKSENAEPSDPPCLRPIVAHQFETVEQQREADILGMWTFLATEVMFFGGLIMCYTFARFSLSASIRGREPSALCRLRRTEHRDPALQQLHDGARRAGGQHGDAECAGRVSWC